MRIELIYRAQEDSVLNNYSILYCTLFESCGKRRQRRRKNNKERDF
jgi:hypothetical protein